MFLAGCAPIYQPSGCPKPCPDSCATSCLASGYCAEALWQPSAAPPVIRASGAQLDLALGDLPPDAPVAISFHGVVDLVARGDSTPWDYSILLEWFGPDTVLLADVIDVSAFNAVDFPVVTDWSGTAQTSSTGVMELNYQLHDCTDRKGRQGQGCIFLPGSIVSVKLLDSSPWKAAPACP